MTEQKRKAKRPNEKILQNTIFVYRLFDSENVNWYCIATTTTTTITYSITIDIQLYTNCSLYTRKTEHKIIIHICSILFHSVAIPQIFYKHFLLFNSFNLNFRYFSRRQNEKYRVIWCIWNNLKCFTVQIP